MVVVVVVLEQRERNDTQQEQMEKINQNGCPFVCVQDAHGSICCVIVFLRVLEKCNHALLCLQDGLRLHSHDSIPQAQSQFDSTYMMIPLMPVKTTDAV